ncbi:hypothetical protein HYX14_03570 [Candidatus Woesearchaeota archaeon]|nr:hypothetical protein [Candidatus Woesearchaeota archaeon]
MNPSRSLEELVKFLQRQPPFVAGFTKAASSLEFISVGMQYNTLFPFLFALENTLNLFDWYAVKNPIRKAITFGTCYAGAAITFVGMLMTDDVEMNRALNTLCGAFSFRGLAETMDFRVTPLVMKFANTQSYQSRYDLLQSKQNLLLVEETERYSLFHCRTEWGTTFPIYKLEKPAMGQLSTPLPKSF